MTAEPAADGRPRLRYVKLAVGPEPGGPAWPAALPRHVALITVSRPERCNALTAGMFDELQAAAEHCASDPAVRAVVVTGAGDRAFVAGIDTGETANLDTIDGTAFALRGQAAFGALASMPRPVIAAIGGYALGAGLELALACDIRVAAENARFGQPEVTLGISPGFGACVRLPRLVGLGAAKGLVFTGRVIGAAEARSIGLVDRVVPAGEHLKAAFEVAGQIAAAAPLAVAAAKEAIDRGLDMPGTDALRLEAALCGRCFGTADQQEGMRAYLEKRERVFEGR